MSELLESVSRLTRDLRNSAKTLGDDDVRFLVDAYYAEQKSRIRAGNQTKALAKAEEPHALTSWLQAQHGTLEQQIQRAMQYYCEEHPVGGWAMSIIGIGPIICAGLLAHIDIEECPTYGHIWQFAGLDPTMKWSKGEKRPWNGSLKRLCWIAGECFTKVSNHPSDVYGHLYAKRKKLEKKRNEAGAFADQAAASLAGKRYGDDTEAKKCYEQGKLPPARIHLRAQRYAVKHFLADLHLVWYFIRYKKLAPAPFPLVYLGHAHYRMPPNLELVPGLQEAVTRAYEGKM